jgi:hypothetical protein
VCIRANQFILPSFPAMSSFTNNSFQSLIASYPSWDEFSEFITSKVGGCVTIVPTGDDSKVVIRYTKGASSLSVKTVQAFRSVVWDTVLNRPVSVTPFKSSSGEGIPAIPDAEVQAEEFADGVLIGQFWDHSLGKWRLHTRSALDATCNYYSTRTFAELFADAVTSCNLSFNDLDRSVNYSWILSHPENRIVCPCDEPKLTLVSQMRIAEDGLVVVLDRNETPEPLTKFLPRLFFVKPYGDEFEAEVQKILSEDCNELRMQGLVFTLRNGDRFRRWKIRSLGYNSARALRGNSARLDYRWLEVIHAGKILDYTKIYPEEAAKILNVMNSWSQVVYNVYNIYCAVFKARSMPKHEINVRYRALVYSIHNHYINVLKPNGYTVNIANAAAFLETRDTAQKLHVINWDINGSGQNATKETNGGDSSGDSD